MHTAPTFLQTVAAHVLAHHAPREVPVVLPSQRAATRFLAEYARLRGGRPGWLPATTTLNGLLQQATGLTPVGSMESLAQLFLAHKAVPKDGDAGGFAAFLQWGRLALQDFNELDQYRCDVDSVLTNLTRIKELDHWHIDDPGELSEAQQRYLQQYERLNPIYHRFQEQLLANGGGTGGSIARAAAERRKRWAIDRNDVDYIENEGSGGFKLVMVVRPRCRGCSGGESGRGRRTRRRRRSRSPWRRRSARARSPWIGESSRT